MDHQHISVGHIFLPCTEGWMSQTINQKTKPKKQTHTHAKSWPRLTSLTISSKANDV